MNKPGPLRVAHVTRCLEVGGQEKMLVDFARHTDRVRHDLTVVSLEGRGSLANLLEANGARVLTLKEGDGLRPRMIWRLARLFRREAFDVVHTHDDKPLIYGVPAARLAGVSTVIHTHHHGPLAWIKRRHLLLMAVAARWTDRFVCVSEASRAWLVSQGVPAAKAHCVRNGIDLSRFPYVGPIADGPIVTVARLSPEKDQETLLRAIALVRREFSDVRLYIAGDGPCRANLEKLAGELELNKQVTFLGEIGDVPALLATASLFVLSSRTEGISLTLLEAMARGLPVVATRVGGNPEVVVDGATGMLVPAHEPHALARALAALLGNTQRGIDLGRAGRSRVEAQFDVRRMVAGYETIYQQCTAGRGHPARVSTHRLSGRPQPIAATLV